MSTGSGKRFRALNFTVTAGRPAIAGTGKQVPAVDGARRIFKQVVAENRRGLPGARVKEVRSLPRLGDEAAVVRGVTKTDSAVTILALRKRNVQVDISVMGSNTRFRPASDGSGVYAVTSPLSRSVVEGVAVATARRVLRILQQQGA